jgi:hypothetical protein
MKPETLLKETLRDWAVQARVPDGLADRALPGRRRRRLRTAATLAGAGAAVAAVTAAAVIVTSLPHAGTVAALPGTTAPTAGVLLTPPPAEPTGIDLHTDTVDSPPRHLIAAGRIAVSAYSTVSTEKLPGDRVHIRTTWYLYDPAAGTYRRTEWSGLDVAPGLRYAAVLERALPARRVGILDMTTREVVKWIDLRDHPVASVAWSPDGTKLVATSYARDPDIRPADQMPEGTSRTGFSIVDVASGRAEFHVVREKPRPTPSRVAIVDPRTGKVKGYRSTVGVPYSNARRDLAWSDDGTLLWEPEVTGQSRRFIDLAGNEVAPPERWRLAVRSWERAGVSPDGTRYADRGQAPGPQTTVKDTATGEVVGVQGVEQLLAWADDDHLIGLGCAGDCEDEFRNGLVLVSVDGEHVTRLSAYRRNSQAEGSWVPLLTRR